MMMEDKSLMTNSKTSTVRASQTDKIGNDLWSTASGLDSGDESDVDLNSSHITLSRNGPTKELFRQVRRTDARK